MKWREAVNVPSDDVIISKLSHRAPDRGDEYIHLINGTSPMILTESGNAKVTVAGHYIDQAVDNLVTVMRIATHGKLCELCQSAACLRYLSSFQLASKTCPRCNCNKKRATKKTLLVRKVSQLRTRIVQAAMVRCFSIHLLQYFTKYLCLNYHTAIQKLCCGSES